MRKQKRRLHPLFRILLLLFILGAATMGWVVGMICIREGKAARDMTEVQKDYEAVIVLGAQVKTDGTPSVQLSLRLEAAAEAWRQKDVPVVVCGAQGKDEPEPEAIAMKRFLMNQGIPENRILTDPDSFNTEQNLAHAKTLLDAWPGDIQRVLIVTSDYHVPRSLALAGDLGLNAQGLGSPCLQEFWLKNHSREALAWCKYWVKKYLHLKL